MSEFGLPSSAVPRGGLGSRADGFYFHHLSLLARFSYWSKFEGSEGVTFTVLRLQTCRAPRRGPPQPKSLVGS
jgi:hypothetical protein